MLDMVLAHVLRWKIKFNSKTKVTVVRRRKGEKE